MHVCELLFQVQVDGEVNPKLQSVHVQDFPISTAHFTRDGTEIVMAGERKSYYVYDMIAGKITRVNGIRGTCTCTCLLFTCQWCGLNGMCGSISIFMGYI